MKPSQLVIIGFGMVGRSLMTHMVRCNNKLAYNVPILIVEPKEIKSSEIFKKLCKSSRQIIHIKQYVTSSNYKFIFEKYILNEAIIVDVSWRVKTSAIIQECQNKQCIYINTAIDEWEHSPLSLYELKQNILDEVKYYGPKMTAVINHGMNPGLVSHITKLFLRGLAEKKKIKNIDQLLKDNKYNQLAKILGLTLIQISERDNQQTNLVTTEKEFYNTWSVMGFIDEALLNTEISYGTHEKKMPFKADTSRLKTTGQIILPIPCHQVRAKTYEPVGGLATGYCIAHAECYSLAKFLMTPDHRISIYYSYLVPDVAKNICHYIEYSLDKTVSPQSEHVLRSDEITSGMDSVGCLFFLRNPEHALEIYWFGSILKNSDIKKLSPEINGTCMQVAVSLLACIEWMIENPHCGIIEPEEVDSDFIISKSMNYLGFFKCLNVTKECLSCGITSDQLSELITAPKDILFT